MRAPNGNIVYTAGANTDVIDFSVLDYYGYGADYVNPGGNDRVTGTQYDDTFFLSLGAETINGRGGVDTVNYGASSAGVDVNLNNTVQHGGFAEGDQLTGIENVTGSKSYGDRLIGNSLANVLNGLDGNDELTGGGGNDTLLGGNGNDALRGGTGADWMDGGDGTDTVDYSGSNGGVSVNLETTYGWLADAQGDRYIGIENVRGSKFDDNIWGDDGDNKIWGDDGDDIVFAGEGNNLIDGGAGDDDLSGGSQRDKILGGDGNDIVRSFGGGDFLDGGAGDDLFIINSGGDEVVGGEGVDILSFAGYPAAEGAVKVDMSSGTATIEGVGVVQFTGIENLIGSNYDDSLLGDAGDNVIQGHHGRDQIDGGAGADVLDGGGGDDELTGGAGADTFVFHTNSAWSQNFDEKDLIFDFAVGTDRLEIHGAVDSLDDLAFAQSGANTVITYGADGVQSIVLANVDMNQLLAHAETDFIFA